MSVEMVKCIDFDVPGISQVLLTMAPHNRVLFLVQGAVGQGSAFFFKVFHHRCLWFVFFCDFLEVPLLPPPTTATAGDRKASCYMMGLSIAPRRLHVGYTS